MSLYVQNPIWLGHLSPPLYNNSKQLLIVRSRHDWTQYMHLGRFPPLSENPFRCSDCQNSAMCMCTTVRYECKCGLWEIYYATVMYQDECSFVITSAHSKCILALVLLMSVVVFCSTGTMFFFAGEMWFFNTPSTTHKKSKTARPWLKSDVVRRQSRRWINDNRSHPK